MTWFTENPWPFLLVGVLAEVILVIILLSTGRGALLPAIVGVAVLNIVLLVGERLIVTDRERIAATLNELTVALASNDVNAVLEFIAPSATIVRARAQQQLPLVKINEARVLSDLEVKLKESSGPPAAEATFNGRISFKLIRGTSPYEVLLRHFWVSFEKLDGRWLITAVEDSQVHAH